MKKYWIWLFLSFLIVLIVWIDFLFWIWTYFLLDSIRFPTDWFQYVGFLFSRFWELTGYRFFHDFFSVLFGYQFFSRFYFIFILFLSGLFWILFSQFLWKILKISKTKSSLLSFCAILLMLINPVLYERMVTQPGIYLAMVVLAYGLYFLLKSKSEFSFSSYLYSGLCFSFSVMISPHMAFMIVLIFVLYLCFFVRDMKNFTWLCFAGALIVLGNLNWLVGGFLGKGSVVMDTLSTLNQANIESFRTNALMSLNVELTTAFLYGFWGEWANHFLLPTTIGYAWIFSAFSLLLLAFYGFYILYKKDKNLTFFIVILWFLGWIFSMWISSQLFGSINQWLFDNVPFYVGLREPQKWIILPLIFILTGSLAGVSWIDYLLDMLFWSSYLRWRQISFLFWFFLLLFLWIPHLLFWFHGQLELSDYPREFFAYRKQFLYADTKIPRKEKFLILPWHSYLACDRTKMRVVANPLKWFLWNSDRLITADNIEIASLYTNSISSQSQAIENFLSSKNSDFLKPFAIKKILFMEHCADYQNYDFLSTLSWLQKTLSGTALSEYTVLDY